MPQLRAAEAGTAECAEHADGLTHRLHPAGRVEVPPCSQRARAAPFTSKRAVPHVPRQATTESFSFSSLPLCAFALPFSSLSAFPALAAHPPETQALLQRRCARSAADGNAKKGCMSRWRQRGGEARVRAGMQKGPREKVERGLQTVRGNTAVIFVASGIRGEACDAGLTEQVGAGVPGEAKPTSVAFDG